MLPSPVSDYLDRLEDGRAQPLVLLLDARDRVIESWGDAGALGLPPPQPGHAIDALEFIADLGASGNERLDCVDPGTGHAVDIHALPQAEGHRYVILLSAERERQLRAQVQQQANETRLLYQRQQKLVDRLVETRSELELRRRESEDALRVKGEFLASVSHEFRTPLTSVIGYADWLTSAMSDNEPARRQARAIARAGQHMVTLVDNILEEAKLENTEATVNADRVELLQLAEDLSAIMAPLAADKGVAFAAFLEPQDVPPVVLDEMRVRQILINLLGNAVKFTEDGFVQLTLSWVNGQLHAEVADSGPGIAEGDRQKIFSAFKRLEGAHRRGGAGLGLHITLRLVKLLGGSIGLDSTPGEGSRFHVRLPAPEAKEAAPDNPGSSGRLLIAEDDPDVIQLMDLFLSRAGFTLEFANDGREAIARLREGQHDLIILDLNMPVLGGIGAIEAIREAGYTGPAVAVTGATLDEERMRAIDAGFDAFVAKPVRMPELIATLRDLLKMQ